MQNSRGRADPEVHTCRMEKLVPPAGSKPSI